MTLLQRFKYSVKRTKHLKSIVTPAVLKACSLSSELLLCSHKILLGVVSRVQQTSLSRSLTTITCSNYKRQVPITHSLIYYITTSTGKNGDTTTNKLLAIIKSKGQQPLPSSPPARSLYSRFLQFTTNHQLDTYSKQNITIESASR